MGQVDPSYEPAMKNIMKWADADASPDHEHGWPGTDSVTSLSADFKSAQFDKDLKSVLIEKAVGKVHTRVLIRRRRVVCTRSTGTSRKRQVQADHLRRRN